MTTTAFFPRRRFLAGAGALASAAVLPVRAADRPIINAPALLENTVGGYRVLPAGSAFCGGVTPLAGHEIVHVLLKPWATLQDGWALVEGHLKAVGRPVQALCGMELRIPEQLTYEGFRAFNQPYVEQLAKWDLLLGRYSAVCRTNVVPAYDAPKVPSLHAFSYCVPAQTTETTFCLSGAADIDQRGRIVASGDVSPAGMKQRLQHCIEVISERLAMLELSWGDATHIDLCVAGDVDDLLGSVVATQLQGAASRGIRVHLARPPIVGAEVELECRGCRRELVVPVEPR